MTNTSILNIYDNARLVNYFIADSLETLNMHYRLTRSSLIFNNTSISNTDKEDLHFKLSSLMKINMKNRYKNLLNSSDKVILVSYLIDDFLKTLNMRYRLTRSVLLVFHRKKILVA